MIVLKHIISIARNDGRLPFNPFESLRFIDRNENGCPVVKSGTNILPSIVETLGIFPDSNKNVQLLLCLEGPTDVVAFKAFSRCLREKYNEVVDLENDKRILVVPLGGSILKYWVEKQYFKNLGCPEVHIYDNDVNTYQKSIDEINAREDTSWGTLTEKFEIENYLHPDAIKAIYDIDVDTTQNDVPKLFGISYSDKNGLDSVMKGKTAKNYLSKVFQEGMNMKYLEEIDPNGEVKGWFDRIASMLH